MNDDRSFLINLQCRSISSPVTGSRLDTLADGILSRPVSREGYLFAAFKLTNDAEVDEIHPVVLSFDNEEACIPLRLTRIAAAEYGPKGVRVNVVSATLVETPMSVALSMLA